MAPRTIQEAYDLALRHHQAGRLEDAERHYQRVLARQPKHAGALQHLGIIAQQRGQSAAAVDWIGRAIAAKADVPEAYYNLGIALNELGRREEAIAAYRQAIALKPEYARALNNLGNVLKDQGEVEEAIEVYGRVIALKPDLAEAYNNLGVVLHEKGRFEEAVAACRQAVALRPDYAEAHCNLGNALKARGRLDEAIAAYQRAIALKVDYAEAYSNLGTALRETGQFEEAVAAYRRAIALKPDYAEAYSNLGVALHAEEKYEEAIGVCRQAIAIKPDLADGYNNLAGALDDQGQVEEAETAYRQAIQVKPDVAYIHWNLAILLLKTGRFAEGWEEFEWRLNDKGNGLRRDFAPPQWNGEDLAGKTLLLHAEGGYGDALQFIRYVSLLGGRAARLILECQAGLVKLFSDLPGIEEVIARGQGLPAFDYHVPLQSLPRLFKTDLTNIPNIVPYLRVPAEYQARWRGRVDGDGRLNVGLAWAGSGRRKISDDLRTRRLDVLAPLGHRGNVRFFSLQKGPESSLPRPPGLELIDFTSDLHDFGDTAALIEYLDLVISVDTSVAHLAGALGKPVWVLIPKVADFRWLMNRTDSPWYPTMCLFRQKGGEDWQSVIVGMAQVLQELCAGR